MGTEPRGIDPGYPNSSSQLAESDAHFSEYVYNDTSGALTIGMPVFVDIRDSGEWNNKNSTTALTNGKTTGGRVCLGSTAAGTGSNLVCVGVYAPQNPSATPNQYDVIRVCDRGRHPVSATAKNGGTAVLVGDLLVTDTTPTNNLISNHNTRASAGLNIAVVTATGTATASGNSVIAVPGSGSTTQLVNAFIQIN